MFDIGWTEMMVVAIVTIVVVGPKDLPKVLRAVGGFVRQARKLAREFQGGVEEFIREAELDDVKNSIHHVSNFDPTSRPDFLEDPTGGKTTQPDVEKKPEQAKSDDGKGAEDGRGDGG